MRQGREPGWSPDGPLAPCAPPLLQTGVKHHPARVGPDHPSARHTAARRAGGHGEVCTERRRIAACLTPLASRRTLTRSVSIFILCPGEYGRLLDVGTVQRTPLR